MRRLIAVAALAAVLVPAEALPQADPPHTSSAMSAKTSAFIETLSLRHLFAIESARLATTRTRNAELRALAQSLLRDHSRAALELERLAARHRLATPEDELNARHRARLEALRRTDDESFDRAYVEQQDARHAETIAVVERYARKGDDRALKRYARDLLPVLRRHGELLRQFLP